jgi:uncharacterized protein YggE
MKLARIAVLAAAGLALAAFAGVFQPTGARSASGADPSSSGITVNGTGSVSVVPDRASFTFGSVSQAETAAEALRASAESVTRIVDALRRAGVTKADLQTAEVSLEPRLNANGDAVVGYTATNSVTATVRKLADAGGVVDAAVAAGANQVYGPNLVASDQDASYGKALEAAVADARKKAELLASTAGTTLGRITSIVETGGTPQPLFAVGAAQDSTPIQPGTQALEAGVTVTFAVG